MQNTRLTKILSLILCVVLTAAIALTTTGCNNDKTPDEGATTVATTTAAPTVKGEGATQFYFTVVGKDGAQTHFDIRTDKKIVGEALAELGLISGDEGLYGLYVKTVNGITVDYDTDKMYWAFYENGKYAAAGVDKTNITAGSTYSFKAEK
ncbi:MAG: DUF4430 domain-containing protein [Clostridia bacterium]|nr:DUF4430 domain-containing protein [Clostridia bacterium]